MYTFCVFASQVLSPEEVVSIGFVLEYLGKWKLIYGVWKQSAGKSSWRVGLGLTKAAHRESRE